MNTDIAFLQAENAKKPIDPPPYLISEWVHGRRVLPPNTPFPGVWDNQKTPYGIEIADNMSPFSPIQVTSVMKGAQLGLTAWAENVVGYWMEPMPSEILYVSATDELLEKWATKRLEPLIDSIGMRHKIHAQLDAAQAKSTRRSGDKVMSKEYPGGTLNMASAQSAAGLRSDSKRILILDEIDGCPRDLKTGEGTWIDVAYARCSGWGARKKILEFSTPTTYELSLIRERYEAGDQRMYNVPCPHCGTLQVLEFKNLKAEHKDGQLFKVWYQCPHCNEPIYNHHKTQMLTWGRWVPTAVARKRGHRSYHLPSLYSPVGMLSWYELYEKYLEAQLTPGGMRSFVNLYLGQPYKEKGSRPKVEKVIELRGEYREGEIPDGVLYLTMGVDVQQGNKGDKENPPRLELEVLGHGAGFRTWSILYKRFEGEVSRSPFEGAWDEMNTWAEQGGLVFSRSDGYKFPVEVCLIDSGDGTNYEIVYAFCHRWGNTYPSKGFQALKKRKDEKGDEIGPSNFKRYRIAKSERFGDTQFVEISTNHYKSWTYGNLKLERRDIEPQAPGFCAFPRDRGEKYFMGLTAEEKRVDGSFHAGSRRNEPLDLRVMALCAGDVFLDARVTEARVAAKQQGCSAVELQQINHAVVLDYLTKQTARRAVA